MELIKYYNKRVRIVDDEGNIFIGKVNDYIYPEDNEPVERESIVLDTDDGQVLEFYEEIIKEIEVLSEYQEFRMALVALVNSIDEEIGLEEENAVLILYKLNSAEKIIRFNEWVKSKMKDDKLLATETEVCRAAVHIAKECEEKHI